MGLRKFLYIGLVHHQTKTVFLSRTTLEKVSHANREWSPSQKIRPPPRGGPIGVPSCAQGREKNHPNPNQANGRENKTTSKTRHDTTITTICYTTKEEKSLQNRNGTPPAALRTRWSNRLGCTRLERYEPADARRSQTASDLRAVVGWWPRAPTPKMFECAATERHRFRANILRNRQHQFRGVTREFVWETG